MSLGIYKQGQGYWVRVLTAALIAVVTLGGAGWMAGQTARFEAQLPRSTYAIKLKSPNGTVAPGERVTLVGKPEAEGLVPKDLGTARIAAYDAANAELSINDVQIDVADADASMAGSVRTATFTSAVDGTARGVPPIEPRLLVGLVVCAVLLLGSIVAYWVAAVKPGTVDFLISTDMEMKKVNWSSWKEIKGSTAVVIGACVLIAGFLYGIDYTISYLFRAIGILVNAG